jgi:hypothetical protein
MDWANRSYPRAGPTVAIAILSRSDIALRLCDRMSALCQKQTLDTRASRSGDATSSSDHFALPNAFSASCKISRICGALFESIMLGLK